MTKKKTKEKSPPKQKRQERRFLPQSANNPWLVRLLGALGAAGLGAGVWAYTYGHSFEGDEKLRQVPAYLIAGSAVVLGVAIWLGTSSDPAVRVGAPGIGVEKGDIRRMPWWGVSQITWESGTMSLAITGNDETGASWSFKVALKSNPDAVAWIVKEAEERIPKKVKISDAGYEHIPAASPHAGTKIDLEPVQVVGRKCAQSGQTISFEPDARVCARCERVYFKRSVPKKCKCGASLEHLRGAIQTGDDDEIDEDEDEDDALEDEKDDVREREKEEAERSS
jgi:hypothetical protein